MNVKVCDAICGSGKTQSCISMMNKDTDKKFIFITPYLSEVERVKEQCAGREFASPEKAYTNGFSKLEDIHLLLKAKKNIASTHALFGYYTEETMQLIKEGNYTLVLDEVINLFQPAEISTDDMNILIKSKTVIPRECEYLWDDNEYSGGAFMSMMHKAKSNNLFNYRDEMYFWSIPPDVFKCFNEIYVLTYMFEYQVQKYFFDIYGINYELIGTKRMTDGSYTFCKMDEMDRRRDLRNKIHILESSKLNEIGSKNGSLSFTWYNKAFLEEDKKDLLTLKNNLYNLFHNVYKCNWDDKMWSTFKDYKGFLKGKGYTNGFIACNKRATNDFSNKRYLAYCINVYMQTWAKNYLIEQGAKNISENMYAISTLIQWVFRSAIRDGKEIWLYLPSKRMRELFTIWLDNLAEGRDLEAIKINEKNYDVKNNKFKNDINKFSRQIQQNKFQRSENVQRRK